MLQVLTLRAGQPLQIAIEAKHIAFNLIQLINGVSIEEEHENVPPAMAGCSGVIN
jgi:hypothetical protein